MKTWQLITGVFAVISMQAVQASPTIKLKAAVLENYADIAHALFEDSLQSGRELLVAVEVFVKDPSEENHSRAKHAWLLARIPYGQTEAYRFANSNVDGWEGKVNAWPLDEGLIDYVTGDYGTADGNRKFGKANVIADMAAFPIIDRKLLVQDLHEADAEEANVATGYHAIEFLLWGQDTNESKTSAGQRPASDYGISKACTSGSGNPQSAIICSRRGQYLREVTSLLVDDLEEMVADWAPNRKNYRAQLTAGDVDKGITKMLVGIGSLSLGELASERMLVALLAHDQEEEHSCFSDNTHVDIAENARGIRNVYLGEYQRINGSIISGPGLSALVAAIDPVLDEKLRAQLDATQAATTEISLAIKMEHFDAQISEGNQTGNMRVRAAVDLLEMQTQTIELAAKTLGYTNLEVDRGSQF